MANINYDLTDLNISLVRNHASKAAGGYKVQLDNLTELVPRTNKIEEYDEAFKSYEQIINNAKFVKISVFGGASNFASIVYYLSNEPNGSLGNLPATNSTKGETYTKHEVQAAIESAKNDWQTESKIQNLTTENRRLQFEVEILGKKDVSNEKRINELEQQAEQYNFGKVLKETVESPEKLKGLFGLAGTAYEFYQNTKGGTPAQTVALGGVNDMTAEEKQFFNALKNILQHTGIEQKQELLVILKFISSNAAENINILYQWATNPQDESQENYPPAETETELATE